MPAPKNVTWTNVSPTIQVTGNSIQKVSGSNVWDAGAVSSQAIVAGDGYMEFTPGETTTWRMCGLGNTDSSVYFGDIEYAFFVPGGGGALQIYESGNLRGSFGTYAASDRLRVAVEGGVVKYYRNGTLVYTSTVTPMYPLQVDSSLNTVNAGVYNVVISGTRVTASPVNYVLQDVQGSTRAVMSGASVVARHDFLPFGEEVAAGVGMRTSGQGFGATDKIRQRYALTERDDTTGLDHTWWRKYENRSGRWTSADPYLGSMTIANPQSFNRFSYVQNDPLNFVDPTGLLPVLVCGYTWMNREYGWVYGCSVRDVPEPQDPHDPRGGGREPQDTKPKRGYDQKKLDECIEKAYGQFKQETAAVSEYDQKLSNLPSKDDVGGSAVGAAITGLLRGGVLLMGGATIGTTASGAGLTAVGSFALSYAGTTIYKTGRNTATILNMGHNAGMRYKNNRQYCVYYFGNSSLPNGGAKLLGPPGFN